MEETDHIEYSTNIIFPNANKHHYGLMMTVLKPFRRKIRIRDLVRIFESLKQR